MSDGKAPAPPAISLDGIDLSLGRGPARVHVLRGISLSVGRGEAVGLVGPSGSGKSTLLMVMAGLERPDSGRVLVEDTDLVRLDEDALARFRGRRIGIVFQSFHLVPTMTALENVALPLELADRPGAHERARAELEAVGLGHGCTITRRSSPAASSSGWPSPARWRPIRRSSSPTSPPATSTRRPAGRSWTCCSASSATGGATLVLVTHDNGLARLCDRTVRLRSGVVEEAVAA